MFKQREMIIIDNPEVSRLLNNTNAAKKLTPFFAKSRTITEAAEIIGIKIGSYHYWINKFLKLGLLQIAYKKKRSGSDIKYYITVAKKIVVRDDKNLNEIRRYFVKAVEEYNNLFAVSYIESLHDLKSDLGFIFTCDKQGFLHTTLTAITDQGQTTCVNKQFEKVSRTASFVTWHELPLSYEDAKELQQRLNDLTLEYEKKSINGASRYLMQLGLIPWRKY